ncbi:MAG: hypothetical protein KDA89_13320, partial [Planctomycetaceae bacterium]|nr:hypothetical protein [Planctomycetaceae bacterium]
ARRYRVAVEAKAEVEHVVTPDLANLLLQAKIQERDAEQGYMRSIYEYNKAINSLRFSKGTTLFEQQIYLAEGNWHPAAAEFALQRAVQRTHAKDRHKLRTEPMEFVGGAAPGSWESLGTNTRPTIPGALGDDAEHPLVPGGPLLPVPAVPLPGTHSEQKTLTPMLVPPAIDDDVPTETAPAPQGEKPSNESPVPRPSAPSPVPVPQKTDPVTQSLSQRFGVQRVSALAPPADADEVDSTGRVRM